MQRREYDKVGEVLYEGYLSNGLQIKVVPKKGFSTFFAAFAVNYGGAHRNFSLDGRYMHTPAGIAHFLEHKMFDMPEGDNALNMLSANGADANAFTGEDMTCYYFQCTHSFEENLRLLLRFVSTPYFTPETVSKEQGIIGQEIRMGEDDPGEALYYNLYSMLFPGHPVADRIAGSIESIAEISDKTLYDCYSMFYRPSNMVLCVEGDVDPEKIMDTAEEILEKDKKTVPFADFPPCGDTVPLKKLMRVNMEVSAPQFMIGARIIPEAPGEALLRQRTLAQLSMRLIAGYSSPFYLRLYSKGLLNRSFDYEVNCAAGTAAVLTGGESPEPEKVMELLSEELRNIIRSGIDRGRFERARRASVGARLRGLEDFGNVCFALASSCFDGCRPFEALGIIPEITAEECEAFIRENLDPERLAISIIESKRS